MNFFRLAIQQLSKLIMNKFTFCFLLLFGGSCSTYADITDLQLRECRVGISEGVSTGSLKAHKALIEHRVGSKKIVQYINSGILLSKEESLIDYICREFNKSGLAETFSNEKWSDRVKIYSEKKLNEMRKRGVFFLEPDELRIYLKVQNEVLKLMSPYNCKQAILSGSVDPDAATRYYATIVKRMSLSEHDKYLKITRKIIIEGAGTTEIEKLSPEQYQIAVNEMSKALSDRLIRSPQRLGIMNAILNIKDAEDRDVCDLYKLMYGIILETKGPLFRWYNFALLSE